MYENAPLLEVIAEIHWELRTIDERVGIQTDPYYFLLQDKFIQESIQSGLSHEEEVVPKFVPLEHSASRPRIRLRKKAEDWPVVQLGPGVMTANDAAPYSGWAEFASFLQAQVACLLNTFADVGQSIGLSKLHLRYIDGFDRRFDFVEFPTFAQDMLSFSYPLTKKFREQHVHSESEFTYALDVSFACKAPTKSTGRLKVSPGKLRNEEALILEISCETISKDRIQSVAQIEDWFNQAHKAISRQFDSLTTSKLKTLMSKTPTDKHKTV